MSVDPHTLQQRKHHLNDIVKEDHQEQAKRARGEAGLNGAISGLSAAVSGRLLLHSNHLSEIAAQTGDPDRLYQAFIQVGSYGAGAVAGYVALRAISSALDAHRFQSSVDMHVDRSIQYEFEHHEEQTE